MSAEKYSPYRVWKSCYTEWGEVLISRMFSNVTFPLSSYADAVICSFAFHQMTKGVGWFFFFSFFFFGDRFVVDHSKVKTPQTTQSKPVEGTQSRCSSYRPQKFIISKGTADDKISRKFETLQRKLHVSQKQYLGQNESDKCVTWLGITLWIYQCVSVQFLLIVQMESCFCCRWCEQPLSSAKLTLGNVENRQIRFSSEKNSGEIITGSFTVVIPPHHHPIDSRKGRKTMEPGSFLASPGWRSQLRTWNKAAVHGGLRAHKPPPLCSLSAAWQITLRGPQDATFQSWMKMNSQFSTMHYSSSLFSLSCQSTMRLSSRAKMKWWNKEFG